MTDLTELERLAKAATPGPWVDDPYGFVESNSHTICQFWGKTEDDFPEWKENAAYIAALYPHTVLKLLDVVKAAKAVAYSNGFDAALPDKKEALVSALRALAAS